MERIHEILDAARRYNPTDDFMRDVYGLSSKEHFDAIVVAPSWLPEKILKRYNPVIDCVRSHTYYRAYRVDFDGIHIGWVQTASGASNVVDGVLSMAEADTEKLVFMGAVGALKADIELGDLVTPSASIACDGASLYLAKSLDGSRFGREVVPHCGGFIDSVIEEAAGKGISLAKKRTFCTESIMCEYAHLDEIRETGAELIEMETAAFYESLSLIGKRGIALLCVSDNSASGMPLIARTPEQRRRFDENREHGIPELLKIACGME